MKKLKVGFIGYRGMVGSVLINRMLEEGDFAHIDPVFFSTSNPHGNTYPINGTVYKLHDAYDIEQLLMLDVIISTHGGEYTNTMYCKLEQNNYTGFWLDASSNLRMKDNAVIVLDPINRAVIDKALASGVKLFIGGNCTVSLMLLALGGLFANDLVEWVSSITYQAVSGAGANNMRELLQQWHMVAQNSQAILNDNKHSILELDAKINQLINSEHLPRNYFDYPIAGNVLPWIDVAMANGQTKEEWKGGAEANKILGLVPNTINIDGMCVRVGAMRCHSQALTIKLKDKNLSVTAIEKIIQEHNPWVTVVANNKQDTLSKLTPAAISNTLKVAIGRLRKLNFGDDFLGAFTVGDQLLWGAAEPIRRMLNIIIKHHAN
ncbi:MAG: aspartate-semialdehyde dehydrogenase [Pseudomonadota bacterium]|jgi:aspartate-semialdehyde dehydrogenase|nr:aspartate-semialdehyde dehydrogenase [Burkholderiales bacterium]